MNTRTRALMAVLLAFASFAAAAGRAQDDGPTVAASNAWLREQLLAQPRYDFLTPGVSSTHYVWSVLDYAPSADGCVVTVAELSHSPSGADVDVTHRRRWHWGDVDPDRVTVGPWDLAATVVTPSPTIVALRGRPRADRPFLAVSISGDSLGDAERSATQRFRVATPEMGERVASAARHLARRCARVAGAEEPF